MSVFDGAESLSAQGGGRKFVPGIYDAVKVLQIKQVEGHYGLRYVVECEVVDGPMDPGSLVSHTVKIDGPYANLGKAQVKAFVAVLNGLSAAEMDALGIEGVKLMERSLTADEPNIGKILGVEIFEKTTKAGHTILRALWRPAAEGSTPAASPPAPAAPPAAASEGEWFDFPEGDPRHGKAQYNRAGETRDVA